MHYTVMNESKEVLGTISAVNFSDAAAKGRVLFNLPDDEMIFIGKKKLRRGTTEPKEYQTEEG